MTARLAIFTICSNNYVAFARTLFDSVRARHPEADLFLCLADRPAPPSGAATPFWTTLPASGLGIENFASLAFGYDIKELNTALKPFMFLHLMQEHQYDTVLYFDPDVQLFGRLDEEIAALRAGASLSLTPHILQPLETAEPPDDITIMRTGVFNLGFLGAARCDEALSVIQWWARRVRHQCLDAQSQGLFVDQKFLDLAPSFAPNCRITRNPGLNVAYWNLAQRKLTQTRTGVQAGGADLVFFHFSGFDPRRPGRLSVYTTRFRNNLPPVLRALATGYAGHLMRNGFATLQAPPYAYDRFASGTPVNEYVRRMFREWTPEWQGDPFATYEDYLQLPWPDAAAQPGFHVTNFMAYLWDIVPGLKAAFDPRRPEGARGLVTWYATRASAELGLDDAMIAPVLAELAHYNISLQDAPAPIVEKSVTDNNRLLLEGLQQFRHRVAPPGSRREDALRAVFQFVLKRLARRTAAARAAETARAWPGGTDPARTPARGLPAKPGTLEQVSAAPR